MTTPTSVDVLIIGAGPGGYAAAIRCGQAGLSTVIVDKSRLGGTCLIRGCIPSKALIHAAEEFDTVQRHASGKAKLGITTGDVSVDFAATKKWKDGIVDQLSGGVAGLLKAAGVRTVTGTALVRDAKTVQVTTSDGVELFTVENLVLATGSVPVELPDLPFGDAVISSTEALDLDEVPDKLVVVGAGYIGLELGTAFLKLGSHVTFVEMADSILPTYDAELTTPVLKFLKRRRAVFHFGARAGALAEDGRSLQVTLADGTPTQIEADRVLVTVGRKPATAGWGLENLGLTTSGPFVKVDERCETSVPGVYAIGDLTGEPMLAHRATAQAEVVADVLAGKLAVFDPVAIPAVVFTDPEIVVVGMLPGEGSSVFGDVIVGKFPLRASGRNLSNGGNTNGFVRIVAAPDKRVLGVQIVGSHVAELQGVAVTAIEMGATLDDLTAIIQAHPSLGESITEAALAAEGHALHIPL